MYDHAWIGLIIVAMKMSSHCSVIVMFCVKDMTLECVSDSVFVWPTYLGFVPALAESCFWLWDFSPH